MLWGSYRNFFGEVRKRKQHDQFTDAQKERFKRLRKFAGKWLDGPQKEWLALIIHLAMEQEAEIAKAAEAK